VASSSQTPPPGSNSPASRWRSARRRPVPEHQPGEQQRVGGLDLQAQGGNDRTAAAGAGEEEQIRRGGGEGGDEQQAPADTRTRQPGELAAPGEQYAGGDGGDGAAGGGDEERRRTPGGELGDRRHEGAVEGAEQGEEQPEALFALGGTGAHRGALAIPATGRKPIRHAGPCCAHVHAAIGCNGGGVRRRPRCSIVKKTPLHRCLIAPPTTVAGHATQPPPAPRGMLLGESPGCVPSPRRSGLPRCVRSRLGCQGIRRGAALAPAVGAAGYRVFVRDSGQPFGAGIDVGAAAPAAAGSRRYIVSGLVSDAAYAFAVSASDAAGSAGSGSVGPVAPPAWRFHAPVRQHVVPVDLRRQRRAPPRATVVPARLPRHGGGGDGRLPPVRRRFAAAVDRRLGLHLRRLGSLLPLVPAQPG